MENENNTKLTNNNNGSRDKLVSPFANSPQDKQEKEDIRTRLDSSRSRNLNENTKTNNLNGLNNTRKTSSLGDKPSIEDDNGKTGIFSRNKKSSSEKETEGSLNANSKGTTETKGNTSIRKGGLGKSLLGGLGNAAANKISNESETGAAMVQTARTGITAAKIIKKLITFFTTPIGWIVAAIIGVILLFIGLPVIIATVVNSLGMKFGLSGNETLEVFNEEYVENLSQEEIEDLMSKADDYMCEQGFFASVRHFFGNWNVEGEGVDQCELAHYVKHLIEEKQKDTNIKTISPGYFMTSLYYAFDTQNRDRDGKLFLNPTDFISNNNDEEAKEVNDLDAITTVMAAKVYNKENLDDLLDNYIFHENLSGSNVSVKRADGSYSTIKGYYYRVWTYFPPETPGGKGHHECVDHTSSNYRIDDKKYKLYLRYGQKVVDEYVNELNENTAYDKTSSECQIWTKHDLSKYDAMANPDTIEDDKAKVTIGSGTYGYDSGFIFKTYPKYDTKYSIDNKVDYNYIVDKDIEEIIRNTESRQDYTNYLLGYPSNVKTELNYNSGLSGGTCTYSINGKDMRDIKVRLLYGKYDPEGKHYEPIEGQELLNFEDYITGVVYSEISGVEEEASKAQAIAARSYAFAYGEIYNRLKEENGQWILEIVNSDEAQAYCDPDKGCYKKCDSGYNVIFTEGTVPSGVTCEIHKPPISEDSVIRKAVRETAGMILLNDNGKPEATNNRGIFGYRDIDQNKWIEMAKNGSKYEEILKYAYPAGNLKTNTCTILASGWILPLDEFKHISSCFGGRYIFGEYSFHGGIDIPNASGNPIYAIQSGTIIKKGYNDPTKTRGDWSYGNYVIVDHGNGYVSLYAHMNKHMESLNVGDTISAGQQIGYVGTTGRSTGNHLHLEIRYNNQKVEPLSVLDPNKELNLTGGCR